MSQVTRIFDHLKCGNEIMKAGIDLYVTKETSDKLKLSSHRLKTIEPLKQFDVGIYTIKPFESQHDCPGSVGFLIYNNFEREFTVFLTDSFYCKYKFPLVSHYLIEANYIKEKLDKRLADGSVSQGQYDRTTRSHMSLETVKELFRNADLKRLQNVILIHLSDSNSDERQMIEEVKQITNCPVYAADKGHEYNFGF